MTKLPTPPPLASAPTPAPRNNAKPIRGRPFKPGNPGRKKGSKNKTTLASEKLLKDAAGKITAKAIKLAEAGDVAAIKICMDRYHPVRKGIVKFQLRPIANVDDVIAALADVTAAVASGVLTFDEAAAASVHIDKVRDAIETVDIRREMAELEKQIQSMTRERHE
jgi:hypothetical protein